MTSQDIEELPLVNRDVYSLLTLVAGVDFTGQATDSFGAPQQQTYINGSPNSSVGSVNYNLDGGTNSSGLRNTGNSIPNPDAVQEFRVVTNSYSAEYGRFAGGVVDVVSKSGTNNLHGSLFEFLRNTRPQCQSLAARAECPAEGSAAPQPVRRQRSAVRSSRIARSSSAAMAACASAPRFSTTPPRRSPPPSAPAI